MAQTAIAQVPLTFISPQRRAGHEEKQCSRIILRALCVLCGESCFNAAALRLQSGSPQGIILLLTRFSQLPELLWQHGYTTFSTGKWHNRRDSFARCFSASGRTFFGGMSDQYAVPVHDFDPAGVYDPQSAYIADGFSTTLFTDDIIDFLNAHQPDDDPFFAYVAFTSPHDPRTPPAPYDSMYQPDEIELPPNFMAEHPFELGVRDIRDEVLADYPRTETAIRGHIADYYGMISHMDAEIGRILATLDNALLSGLTTRHRRSIFSAYQGVFGHPQGRPCQRSVKDGRYKLIQSVLHGKAIWQLFDLQEDPSEIVNLVAEPSCGDVVQRLRQDLHGWQHLVHDPIREAV